MITSLELRWIDDLYKVYEPYSEFRYHKEVDRIYDIYLQNQNIVVEKALCFVYNTDPETTIIYNDICERKIMRNKSMPFWAQIYRDYYAHNSREFEEFIRDKYSYDFTIFKISKKYNISHLRRIRELVNSMVFSLDGENTYYIYRYRCCLMYSKNVEIHDDVFKAFHTGDFTITREDNSPISPNNVKIIHVETNYQLREKMMVKIVSSALNRYSPISHLILFTKYGITVRELRSLIERTLGCSIIEKFWLGQYKLDEDEELRLSVNDMLICSKSNTYQEPMLFIDESQSYGRWTSSDRLVAGRANNKSYDMYGQRFLPALLWKSFTCELFKYSELLEHNYRKEIPGSIYMIFGWKKGYINHRFNLSADRMYVFPRTELSDRFYQKELTMRYELSSLCFVRSRLLSVIRRFSSDEGKLFELEDLIRNGITVGAVYPILKLYNEITYNMTKPYTSGPVDYYDEYPINVVNVRSKNFKVHCDM